MIAPCARLWLTAIIAGAVLLRVVCIDWGLPPAIPHVADSGIRSSYSFDEDDVLTHVSFTAPASFDLDFRLYHWGTFHFWLLLGWLEVAEATGYIGRDWREAYYHLIPGAFERVYRVGRLLSIAISAVSICAVYLLGKTLLNAEAGVWSAALTAASPAHLLASVQVRVDMTMLALVTTTAWLAVLALGSQRRLLPAAAGITAGLAASAKYPALIIVLPILLVVLWQKRDPRLTWIMIAACAGGFLLGQPHTIARWPEIVRQMREIVHAGQNARQDFALSTSELIGTHASFVFRFLIGPVATALGVIGLVMMARVRQPVHLVIPAAAAGCILTWIPLQWPLLRYELPLLPVLSVAAAMALASLNRTRRIALGVLALMFPVAASIAQAVYMRAPHPANRALAAILESVPPPTDVARMAAELPPLDRKLYPMGPNPLLDDISRKPPSWVLTADLSHREHPATTLNTLQTRFERVAVFETARLFPWATLGEHEAPHDWKYTHPRMELHRRLR